MKTKKKLLIGIGVSAIALLCLVAVYVFATLGRVRHVSLDEARKLAQQSLASGEADELLDITPLPGESVDAANGDGNGNANSNGNANGDESGNENYNATGNDGSNINGSINNNSNVAGTPDSSISGVILDGEVDLSQAPQTTLTLTEEERLKQDFTPDVVNILLLGVDRRGGGASRADTIFIATLDKANKKLKLASLMRDMYVPIPGKGEQRINTSSVYGGPGLTIDTINQNFSLDLKDYILIDFRMFEKMVDALGGITMTLTAGEVSAANDCIAGLNKQRGVSNIRAGFITKAGSVRLDGKQALGYARIRHYGNGDYQRTNRQFKVLLTIFEKFMDMNIITQQKVLYEILPFIETNLESVRIIELAMSALSIGTGDILHYRLPVEGMFQARSVRGMAVLLPDIKANTQALHEFIYRMTESPIQKDSLSVGAIGTYQPPPPLPTPTPEGMTPVPSAPPSPTPTPAPTEPPPIDMPNIFDANTATPTPDDGMFKPLF